MSKKFLFLCALSFISAQSLFAAQKQTSVVVDPSRHDKWREIALFPWENGMSRQKTGQVVSDKLAVFDQETMTLSMGTNEVTDIKPEDLPLVEVVLKEVKEAYVRFTAQPKK